MSIAAPGRRFTMDRRRLVNMVARFREFGILLVLVLLVVITAVGNSNFLTSTNIEGIALDTAILVILAIGETVVILTRNIDLSVGAVLGFSALFVGVILKIHPGVPVPAALLLGAAVGLLFGLGNGLLVALGEVPAIIATLGTLGIYRGFTFVYSSGSNQHEITASDLPNNFLALATQTFLGVKLFLIIPVLLLLAAGYWLGQTRSGREMYAVGGNGTAARLAGINSRRTVLLAFALSGALAGLGGVLYLARYAQVDTLAGSGMELNVIAAVVIGGTSTLGGVGGVLGTLIGCVLLSVINNSLVLLTDPGSAQFWSRAVYGLVILGAVIADALITGRLQRALRRRRA
ncbi:MAG TPA: ABC transporter permease [Chloroflexota bacterium]|nr:ABC transporter permease [Chloroflexota bacterium]